MCQGQSISPSKSCAGKSQRVPPGNSVRGLPKETKLEDFPPCSLHECHLEFLTGTESSRSPPVDMVFHLFGLRALEVSASRCSRVGASPLTFSRSGCTVEYVEIHRMSSQIHDVNPPIQLIRSPLFHQMVGRVHQRVEQIRHGIPPEPSRTTLEEKGRNPGREMCCFVVQCS